MADESAAAAAPLEADAPAPDGASISSGAAAPVSAPTAVSSAPSPTVYHRMSVSSEPFPTEAAGERDAPETRTETAKEEAPESAAYRVLLVGESAAGKTSLAALLQGLEAAARDDVVLADDTVLELRRRSATSKTPELTRHAVNIHAIAFDVIDTAGFVQGGEEKEHALHFQQTMQSADDLHCVIFVVDGTRTTMPPAVMQSLKTIISVMGESIAEKVLVVFTHAPSAQDCSVPLQEICQLLKTDPANPPFIFIENPLNRLAGFSEEELRAALAQEDGAEVLRQEIRSGARAATDLLTKITDLGAPVPSEESAGPVPISIGADVGDGNAGVPSPSAISQTAREWLQMTRASIDKATEVSRAGIEMAGPKMVEVAARNRDRAEAVAATLSNALNSFEDRSELSADRTAVRIETAKEGKRILDEGGPAVEACLLAKASARQALEANKAVIRALGDAERLYKAASTQLHEVGTGTTGSAGSAQGSEGETMLHLAKAYEARGNELSSLVDLLFELPEEPTISPVEEDAMKLLTVKMQYRKLQKGVSRFGDLGEKMKRVFGPRDAEYMASQEAAAEFQPPAREQPQRTMPTATVSEFLSAPDSEVASAAVAESAPALAADSAPLSAAESAPAPAPQSASLASTAASATAPEVPVEQPLLLADGVGS